MSDLLNMKEITFTDDKGEIVEGIDLTIDTCDFSITLPIDTRRMNTKRVEELINLLS